ncbi:hypothetical protein DUNSADRAFT_3030 [Dunaliella salina]|uniref:Encoded protein n=1 Tax=Dunaliella salina TaxID=3046 RepID=A0ABQ7FVQ7_DUNSA|nr:hypothetical protein DUNSADRAFT_3030 [Dunaliella salina]|eukprot:KAF5826464.1 hypothetical protein DUNSADRAFT_3030 [Dunaliella salina]
MLLHQLGQPYSHHFRLLHQSFAHQWPTRLPQPLPNEPAKDNIIHHGTGKPCTGNFLCSAEDISMQCYYLLAKQDNHAWICQNLDLSLREFLPTRTSLLA